MSVSSFPAARPKIEKLLLSHDPEDALDKSLQDHIISSLWPSQENTHPSVYLKYLQLECETWTRSATTFAVETYRDFLDLVDHLKRNRHAPRNSPIVLGFFPRLSSTQERLPSPLQDTSRQSLHLPLRDRYASCESAIAEASIFLVVRLWLMLNVGPLDTDTFVPGTSLEWPEDQSLDDVIKGCFQTADLGPKVSQWRTSLNASSIERIGGFEIIWTDNLADHLYLSEENDTISVYHHVQVLHGLRHKDASDEVLPDRLLLETLQTLALLVPRHNRESLRWFKKVYSEGRGIIDEAAGDVKLLPWARCPEKYNFWGPRLLIIRDAYDNSEPKHLGQWWHDRRRKVQWYTFWVAILVLVLTIVFGLIQSVTGVMQVYYSTHPVHQRA